MVGMAARLSNGIAGLLPSPRSKFRLHLATVAPYVRRAEFEWANACRGETDGRAAAPEQRDPRLRGGQTRLHVFRASRSRNRGGHEHVEVRRRGLRNGAQFLGRASTA